MQGMRSNRRLGQEAMLAAMLVACAGASGVTLMAPAQAQGVPQQQRITQPVNAQPARTSGVTTPGADVASAFVETSGKGARSAIPQRETLLRMMQRVSVDFQETRLEDVLVFLRTVTDADLEILWEDDVSATGLNKDTTITARAQNATALRVLEIVLERADGKERPGQAGAGSTWQLSESGAMQVGPRERLNVFKRTEVYDVADLILEVPNYDNAPELDLQQALQASQRGGGGGGQSPFQDEGDDEVDRRSEAERIDELIDLLTTLVEEEQWEANGGNGGTMRRFQRALIVKAPDYIHRALNGYSYWPASSTQTSSTKGRRYVSLGVDTSVSDVGEVVNYPINAVTGGGQTPVDPGGGG